MKRTITKFERCRVRIVHVTESLRVSGVESYDVEVQPFFGTTDEWVLLVCDVSERCALRAYDLVLEAMRVSALDVPPAPAPSGGLTARQADDLSDSLVRLVKAGKIAEARDKARANGWPEDTVDEVAAFHGVALVEGLKCSPEDSEQAQGRANRKVLPAAPDRDYFDMAVGFIRTVASSSFAEDHREESVADVPAAGPRDLAYDRSGNDEGGVH